MEIQRVPSSAGSIASMASSSCYSARSVFEDMTFAPPPQLPKSLEVVKNRFLPHTPREVAASLPVFDRIKHSGEVMARFSVKSMMMKKWKPVFWITYGNNEMLFFRSKSDFDEWVSNPFLENDDRNKLVKLRVDFMIDVNTPGSKTTGYEASPVKIKEYSREGKLSHFKLERWSSYGPSLLAAFGGKNVNAVKSLHRIMQEMIIKFGYGNQIHANRKLGYDSEISNSSYYGSETQSNRDYDSNYGGSNYGGYMSDAGRSTRSAPAMGYSSPPSSPDEYSDLLLESVKSYISNRKEPEVPPMPKDASWAIDFDVIAAADAGQQAKGSSWKDKFSRSKSAPKIRPGSADSSKGKGLVKRLGRRPGTADSNKSRGFGKKMGRRPGSADPNYNGGGLGKKKLSLRFGKKKKEEQHPQSQHYDMGGGYYDLGGGYAGSQISPTYSMGSNPSWSEFSA